MKEYNGYSYSKVGESYTIYNENGKAWIEGFETEEEAKKQIDDLIRQKEETRKEQATLESLQEQITNLELALVEIYEMGGKN